MLSRCVDFLHSLQSTQVIQEQVKRSTSSQQQDVSICRWSMITHGARLVDVLCTDLNSFHLEPCQSVKTTPEMSSASSTASRSLSSKQSTTISGRSSTSSRTTVSTTVSAIQHNHQAFVPHIHNMTNDLIGIGSQFDNHNMANDFAGIGSQFDGTVPRPA